jgi:hypothetical protein
MWGLRLEESCGRRETETAACVAEALIKCPRRGEALVVGSCAGGFAGEIDGGHLARLRRERECPGLKPTLDLYAFPLD